MVGLKTMFCGPLLCMILPFLSNYPTAKRPVGILQNLPAFSRDKLMYLCKISCKEWSQTLDVKAFHVTF
jgi:hypothetical protein